MFTFTSSTFFIIFKRVNKMSSQTTAYVSCSVFHITSRGFIHLH